MRENKFEKSHIHIMKSETLSRESRFTESAKVIVNSIPLKCKQYTFFLPVVNTFILFVRKKEGGLRGE